MHKFHYITKIRFIMSIKKAFMMAEHWLLIERQKFLHLVIVISCFLWKAVLLLYFIVCFFSQCFLLKELINQNAAMTLVKPQNWLPCLEFRKLVMSHSLVISIIFTALSEWKSIYHPHPYRKSPSKVLLGKGVLKVCIKFTGEHPCRSVILIKQLHWYRTLAWVFSCKFTAYFQKTFSEDTSGWLLLPLLKSYFS